MPLETPPSYVLAPVHALGEGTPLKICVLVQSESSPAPGLFVLLREVPGSRVYLGAVCDAETRIQEWVEIWVQSLETKDLAFTGYQEQFSNHAFDQRWRSECALSKETLPAQVITTAMEQNNPSPILIKQTPPQGNTSLAMIEVTNWRICTDDSLLASFGLPPYSTSLYRYLHRARSIRGQNFSCHLHRRTSECTRAKRRTIERFAWRSDGLQSPRGADSHNAI